MSSPGQPMFANRLFGSLLLLHSGKYLLIWLNFFFFLSLSLNLQPFFLFCMLVNVTHSSLFLSFSCLPLCLHNISLTQTDVSLPVKKRLCSRPDALY